MLPAPAVVWGTRAPQARNARAACVCDPVPRERDGRVGLGLPRVPGVGVQAETMPPVETWLTRTLALDDAFFISGSPNRDELPLSEQL